MIRLALITATEARALDTDLPPLLQALRALGVEVEVVSWDDPDLDWSRFRLALVRSTWDYTERYPEFLDWVGRAASRTTLLNPPQVLRWNTDKHYLGELDRAGLPVVRTFFVEPGAVAALPEELLDGELVVKPAVSAGAKNTHRYDARLAADRAAALAHLRALLDEGRSVMLQPFLAGVDRHGETALLYFEGRFSHAIRKGPILSPARAAVHGLFAAEAISPRQPAADELEVGAQVLSALTRVPAVAGHLPLLYARVDLIRDQHDRPTLLELEVTEPSLFLDGEAARLLGDALLRRSLAC